MIVPNKMAFYLICGEIILNSFGFKFSVLILVELWNNDQDQFQEKFVKLWMKWTVPNDTCEPQTRPRMDFLVSCLFSMDLGELNSNVSIMCHDYLN